MIEVTIAGRLGKDAEVRQAGQNTVCSFTVAADTGFGDKKQTYWYDCSIWGRRGEGVAQYLKKGQEVTIIGEYSEREYNGKSYKELQVHNLKMSGGKNDNQSNHQTSNTNYQVNNQNGNQNAQPNQFNNQTTPAVTASGASDDSIPFAPYYGGV